MALLICPITSDKKTPCSAFPSFQLYIYRREGQPRNISPSLTDILFRLVCASLLNFVYPHFKGTLKGHQLNEFSHRCFRLSSQCQRRSGLVLIYGVHLFLFVCSYTVLCFHPDLHVFFFFCVGYTCAILMMALPVQFIENLGLDHPAVMNRCARFNCRMISAGCLFCLITPLLSL